MSVQEMKQEPVLHHSLHLQVLTNSRSVTKIMKLQMPQDLNEIKGSKYAHASVPCLGPLEHTLSLTVILY